MQKECYEYIKNSLNSDVLESKFDYFYLGANLKDFDLSKADIRDDFKELFKTKNVFITVSTIEPRKNHKYIVDSFDKLSYDFTDLKKYESKAALRFVLKNIVKKDLDTPQKVHPKKSL